MNGRQNFSRHFSQNVSHRIAIAGLFAVALAGCSFDVNFGGNEVGTGTIVTREVDVAEFSMVDVDGAFVVDVEVVPGAAQNVRITTDDNLQDYVELDVDGDTLSIDLEPGNYESTEPFQATIVVSSLDGVAVSGASSVSATGIDASDFDVDGSGASVISLTGETTELTLELSGASELEGVSLKADEVDVDLSGASNAHVTAKNRVTGSAAGASGLEISGEATDNVETSGASTVTRS